MIRFLPFLFALLLAVSFPENTRAFGFPDKDSSLSDTGSVIIHDILITGNKKTKASIILRECSFSKGDTLSMTKFRDLMIRSRNRVFNTGLFVTVDFYPVERSSQEKDILIVVKERWYIYPVPIFELADRNFSEWWSDRHRDISRVNLGVYYIQKNVRGRNETLKLKAQAGFTKKLELFYYIPYLNRRQRSGLNFEFSYILNKQVAYKTSGHKLIYFDYNKIARERFRTGFNFFYRRRFYQTHYAGITFQYNNIADTVAALNPDYLLQGRTSQRYFALRYAFVKDVRDVAYYPLKGSYLRLEGEKAGLGIWKDLNQLTLIGEYDLFKPLGKKFYFAGQVKQKVSFPTRQPYLQTRGLGYEKDYVSGYELYVIDGQHFSLGKVNLKYRLFSSQKEVNAVPVEQFETVPFAIYFKVFSDAGYVVNNWYNPENRRLSNKFLLGGGAGLDVVSYYDFVMRLEYSVNLLGQTGFYLHFRSAI